MFTHKPLCLAHKIGIRTAENKLVQSFSWSSYSPATLPVVKSQNPTPGTSGKATAQSLCKDRETSPATNSSDGSLPLNKGLCPHSCQMFPYKASDIYKGFSVHKTSEEWMKEKWFLKVQLKQKTLSHLLHFEKDEVWKFLSNSGKQA